MSSIPPSFFGSLPALVCVLACQWPVSATGAPGSTQRPAPAGERVAPCSAAELPPGTAALLGGMPDRIAGYCLDPFARIRSYGSSGAAPLSQACEQVLGPGCADDDRLGLERVLALRYVDASGLEPSVDVLLSRFAHREGAYAHFTQRLVGDLDPTRLGVSPFEAPGVAVLDGDRVLAWRGSHTLWLRYIDPRQVAEQLVAAAARDLPSVARELLDVLPDEGGLPSAVARLPDAQRIPLGARLMLGDALGVPGLGMSARGYYREESKRWRVLSIVRPDAESAKDVLGTLARHPSAKKIKGIDALQFVERRLPSEPHVGWVVAQRGAVIYGVGDEASVLPEHMRRERELEVKLSLHEKLVKLTRMNHR